jgi:light-regulated signal transduction histidine kinase (bacteriophytochrome)
MCILFLSTSIIIGCSDDDAEELVADIVDIDFNETATLQLNTLSVSQTEQEGQVVAMALATDCPVTSINNEINNLDFGDVDVNIENLTINSITLNSLSASYVADWDTETTDSLNCELTFTRVTDVASETLDETIKATVDVEINTTSSGLDTVNVDTEDLDIINYFFNNRDEYFKYCMECDGAPDFSVDYTLVASVTVDGNL